MSALREQTMRDAMKALSIARAKKVAVWLTTIVESIMVAPPMFDAAA